MRRCASHLRDTGASRRQLHRHRAGVSLKARKLRSPFWGKAALQASVSPPGRTRWTGKSSPSTGWRQLRAIKRRGYMVSLLERLHWPKAHPEGGFAGIRISTGRTRWTGNPAITFCIFTAIELGVQSMAANGCCGQTAAATPRRTWCNRRRESGSPAVSWGCR